jgi:hypothetical protein
VSRPTSASRRCISRFFITIPDGHPGLLRGQSGLHQAHGVSHVTT